MRRLVLLVAVAAVVTVVLSGTAFAQSCFDNYNRSTPRGPQPPVGGEISLTATSAATPGAPKSGTPELAHTVGLLTDAKKLCQ